MFGVGARSMFPINPNHWRVLETTDPSRWPVIKLFMQPDIRVVHHLVSNMSANEAAEIAPALMELTEILGTTLCVLRMLICIEVQSNLSSQTLFRVNSIASHFMRLLATKDRNDLLNEVLHDAYEQACQFCTLCE